MEECKCKRETTFENAKVGDEVYSLAYGRGKIIDKEAETIVVQFPLIERVYAFSGFFINTSTNIIRDLYWSKPELIAPERPKRKVKKTFTKWVNVYRGNMGEFTYSTEEQAKKSLSPTQVYLFTHKIEVEVEVEE